MEEGDIPGLSVIVVNNGQLILKSYGYSDLKTGTKVNSKTLFQLGSCSKAFTGLAISKLVAQGLIDVDKYVSDYIPWFQVHFEGEDQKIKVRHLIYHTSGIPWSTISKIPVLQGENALELTIRKLVNQELSEVPGKKYEYATINYDILALILQKVTNISFEEYMKKDVLEELSLSGTTVGIPNSPELMSKGYKIGFFKAREFEAPVYQGNNAAGYLISNAEDIGRWLKFNMGYIDSEMKKLLPITHQRDKSVALHGMSAYAYGWQIALDGSGEVYHDGLNPNYSSYITFRPDDNIGVAVLANSNSPFTSVIGDKLIKVLAREEIPSTYDPGDRGDKTYVSVSIALGFYMLVVVCFLLFVFLGIVKQERVFEGLTWHKLGRLLLCLIAICPFLLGFYLLPRALFSFTWESIFVWTPMSFEVMIWSILLAISLSYLVYFITVFFPEQNEYKRKAPQILLMSILSGLSNVIVIMMVTSVIDSDIDIKFLIFYYVLTIGVYLLGRRYVQINLIRFTRGLVYDLRIQLIDKIFSTAFEKFETIDRGRVYTALNDDVNTIGNSTNLFVTLITSIITAVGAFLYLASLAFWATLITILLIVTIATLYYFAGQSTNIYYEKARDSRDVFMRLINGMIDGFKEISLHLNKKNEYKNDVADSAGEYRDKISKADIMFVDAFLVGESLLVVLLGVVSIGMLELFPNVGMYTVISFVIVLLYLIGPVNGILAAVPSLINLKIAWKRVKSFINEIPSSLDLNGTHGRVPQVIDKLEIRDLRFNYKNREGQEVFGVGPFNLKFNRGEVVFIIGGNGSGKTTFAKLLTGLYTSHEGKLLINGEIVQPSELSEYFSAVFSPPYLFNKLYNINVEEKKAEIDKYMTLLDLDKKVKIDHNGYSSIKLSSGQRKRLALLQCYIEDMPIYLFDEWAADQDPEYRNFFYRSLLPEMKMMGKIVVAITHDAHYFDVADRVLRMENGQLEECSTNVLA
ncbi:hypothetical protein GCM10009122_34840 [Fulvivirga kasyanovii]